jgi:hypothetical protein
MRVQVLHDGRGRIRSITQVNPETKFGVTVVPPRGHSVTEVELPAELQQVPLHTLHDSHRLDIETKGLVQAPAKKAPARTTRRSKRR